MIIEDSIRTRILSLIQESQHLARGNEYGQCTDSAQRASCSGWITAAHNVVHLVISQVDAPYRKKADQIAQTSHGYLIHEAVAEFSLVLSNLLKDADAGLLSAVADQARAEAFDDFLDHANYYFKSGKKHEAGVIAGVVFEDAVRRVSRKLGIEEKGQRLDALISELAARSEISAVKAKRARVAADVRTKATHAQWDEFELEDVRATIDFTRELIEAKLA